jgi:hypothetical protein
MGNPGVPRMRSGGGLRKMAFVDTEPIEEGARMGRERAE